MYVTLPQLAEMPGALELAQVASDKFTHPVAAALMEATLRSTDRSAFPADDVAHADRAVARINQGIEEAQGIIDGFLARRYTLPLVKTPGILITWARAIVRYKLHDDRQTDDRSDPVVRDYRDAMKLLEQIAQGKFSLGVEDPNAGTGSAGEIQISPGEKVFGRGRFP